MTQATDGDAIEPELCASCNAVLSGPFCAQCGEKVVDAHHDYSLGHFVQHAMHDFTHFDTKLFRSLRPLLTRPGWLTNEFLAGRRTRFIRPLPMFILLNIAFFFVGSRMGFFNFDYAMYVENRPLFFVVDGRALAESRRTTLELEPDVFVARFNATSKQLKKSLIVVTVPLFAAVLALLFRGRRRYFVEHLVFSLHFWSFWLIVTIVVPLLLVAIIMAVKWASAAVVSGAVPSRTVIRENLLLSMMFVGMTIYLAEAVRRVYGSGSLRAWFEGTVLALCMLGTILVYRDLLFFVTLVSM
jgi:hypothetical protein